MAPEDENQQIEIDEVTDMDDEAYGGNDESTLSTSLSSSILAYRMENGRRYHAYKAGSYPFPNDEIENDRLDMQHAVFLRSLDGRLCLCPVKSNIQNVLDVADEHPSAQIIGTDLSPIQPSLVPPNLSFLIDDAEAEWQYHQKFDLIHGRMLTGSLKDWDRFYIQCYENLEPGGYVEMQDICLPLRSDDGTLTPDHPLDRWSRTCVEACAKLERPLDVAKSHKKRMEEAGFVDVVEVLHKWPLNSWAKDPKLKEIGNWTMTNMLEGLQAWSIGPFTRGLGWSLEQVEAFLVDVRRDVKDRKLHVYWPMYFVYGRKPETSKK
ncbi:conserved hypothetical protein [Microsporum canis CBS 113480]|uniref:TAM domain methyltransferase n=1 Tax=Arthroderma otae (strain ATCC MYA-4605 / CBS 113480) TaxID=554155 RepID=C5FBH7_ARTOC|nr:conserved hypothetical protein [Microsporum canis CBS 113480]EEQ27161.1 conserved hypothetical protein [Microsporum canis CBS 113480]